VARAAETLSRWFAWDDAAEVTLEVNPDDVTPDAARAWRAAGVTRASIGSQTFDPAALAWMRRGHSAEQVERAVADLRASGIDELSLDLIFALPDAVARDWRGDVCRALALAPTHLSLYGTHRRAGHAARPLGGPRRRGGGRRGALRRRVPRRARAARRGRASTHYEVSNFARPGRRARHNSAYWRGRPVPRAGPVGARLRRRTPPVERQRLREWVRARRRRARPDRGDEAIDRDARAPRRSISACAPATVWSLADG
jgi:oxygen-independent coproporphyrinogen-3 oxidase